MLAKSSIIASAALVLGLLGSALPALAEYDYELYGGPHQTWCDVNPDCNGWNKRQRAPAAYQSNASGRGDAAQSEASAGAQAQPRRQGPLGRHAGACAAGAAPDLRGDFKRPCGAPAFAPWVG